MIARLYSENIKCLKVIDISPNDEWVKFFVGKNAAGKSATLLSIILLLAGGRNIPDDIVREGEDNAEILIDTDIFTARRVWTSRSKHKLEVTIHKKEYMGMSPVAFLKKVTGDLSFDPLAFIGMDKAQQIEQLKKTLDLDFEGFDRDYDSEYKARTEVNREITRIEGELSGLEDVEKPEEIIPIRELQEKRDKLYQENERISNASERLIGLEEERAELLSRLDGVDKLIEETQQLVQKQPHDLSEIDAKIEAAADAGARAEKWKRKSSLTSELDALQETSKKHTKELDRLKKAKSFALAKANDDLGIEYLNFDENGLTYKGRDLSLASQKEQIEIVMQIAMRQDPPFKLVIIREGGYLDDDSLKYLKKIAARKEYFVYIEYPIGFMGKETVEELKEIGEVFYIEDGQLSSEYHPQIKEGPKIDESEN